MVASMGERVSGRDPSRVTAVVCKNISELDFLLPVVWRMRRLWPHTEIVILYASHAKSQILRECTFYSEGLRDFGATELDMLDSVPWSAGAARLLGQCVLRSNWDYRETRNGPMAGAIDRGRRAIAGRLATWADRRFDAGVLRRRAQAPILFWPHRSAMMHASGTVWRALGSGSRTIIHYPHGPYYSGGSFRIQLPPDCRDAKDGDVPRNHDVWYPHMADNVADAYPEDRERFFFSGYPGLDTAWLEYVRSLHGLRSGAAERGCLNCLFLIRKFEESGTDEYAFRPRELLALCSKVSQGIRECGRKVRMTVKPHPSNDYPATRALLNSTGAADWDITYDPVYLASVKSDLVVSVPSTSNLIPALLGLPTVLLNCSVKEVFDRWAGMRRLYPDSLQFYAPSLDDIPRKIAEASAFAWDHPRAQGIPVMPTNDVAHFRREFPDGMLESIEARLKTLFEERWEG